MMKRNRGPALSMSLLPSKDDLHTDPLLSRAALLQLLPGAYPVALQRWQEELGMPKPVHRGKYSATKMLSWIWEWKCRLETELREVETQGKDDPVSKQREQLKLRRETMEFERDFLRVWVRRAEFEEAEAHRIALAVSFLQTFPDRLIMAGLMPAENKDRALDLIGTAVEAFQVQIETDDPIEQPGSQDPIERGAP